MVRSERAGTSALLDELRRAVWSVNGNLSLASVRTLGEMYERSMARTSMTLRLLAITGLLALVLGLVGVYGLVSYAVAQRQREIGIRIALGAGHGVCDACSCAMRWRSSPSAWVSASPRRLR